MKMIASLLLAVLFVHSVSAQKVDLDPYNFTYEYRDLPHTIIDPNLKTYRVSVDAAGAIQRAMSNEVIADRLELQGFRRSPNDADVRIMAHFDDLIINSNKVVENVYESKEKDGTVHKTYSYYLTLEYTVRGYASVTARDGHTLIKEFSAFSGNTKNWSSTTYKTRSEAESYYYNNKNSIVNNLANERINEAIVTINNSINYDMGFPVEKDPAFLWLVANKKHTEHEEMVKRWEVLKPVLLAINANGLTEDTKLKINAMIDYFNSMKTKYAGEDKGEKKIRYAAFYNNAMLYMIMDQPENAIKECDGLIANDYDPKDGTHMKERAEKLIELFQKNNIYTRHFNAMEEKPYKK
jgi:hypothetical protein